MQPGHSQHKGMTCNGFSLIETLVAVAVVGVTFFALYSALTYCYSITRFARENLRATQIMVEKLEVIRLYNWEQLNDPAFLPKTFQATYAPVSAMTTSGNRPAATGPIYQGTVTVANAPMYANYSDKVRLVRVDLTWNTSGVQRRRSMETLVTFIGLHNYVY